MDLRREDGVRELSLFSTASVTVGKRALSPRVLKTDSALRESNAAIRGPAGLPTHLLCASTELSTSKDHFLTFKKLNCPGRAPKGCRFNPWLGSIGKATIDVSHIDVLFSLSLFHSR